MRQHAKRCSVRGSGLATRKPRSKGLVNLGPMLFIEAYLVAPSLQGPQAESQWSTCVLPISDTPLLAWACSSSEAPVNVFQKSSNLSVSWFQGPRPILRHPWPLAAAQEIVAVRRTLDLARGCRCCLLGRLAVAAAIAWPQTGMRVTAPLACNHASTFACIVHDDDVELESLPAIAHNWHRNTASDTARGGLCRPCTSAASHLCAQTLTLVTGGKTSFEENVVVFEASRNISSCFVTDGFPRRKHNWAAVKELLMLSNQPSSRPDTSLAV